MRRRSILSLFRGPRVAEASAAASRELPPCVIAAIEDASIVIRPGNDDGPRAIVQFTGWAGFIFSDEGAGKVLARMFQDLSPGQVGHAVQRLRFRVRGYLRGLELSDPERRPWISRY